MKRYTLLWVVLAAALVLSSANVCLAIFPVPDLQVIITLQQGWFDGNLAWFTCTDTNDVRFATTQDLTLAHRLHSALGFAPTMWIVLNPPATQGPIFSTRPGAADYAGIWEAALLTWNPGVPSRPLISEADVAAALVAGEVTEDRPGIIADCPILGLGRAEPPWLPKADISFYRIPQGSVEPNFPATKQLKLPAWFVYCQDNVSKAVNMFPVIIPDVGDAALASALGANLAPGLLNIPSSDAQSFWVMRSPKPPFQLPVVEACPNSFSWRNTRTDYSPLGKYTILHRNISPSTTVDNPEFLLALIGSGGLVVASNVQRINAPIVNLAGDPPEFRVKKRNIKIFLCDWKDVDGDRVELKVNGVVVAANILLGKCPDNVGTAVALNAGKNTIEVTALNTGTSGLNTPRLRFETAFGEMNYELDAGETGTVIVIAP